MEVLIPCRDSIPNLPFSSFRTASRRHLRATFHMTSRTTIVLARYPFIYYVRTDTVHPSVHGSKIPGWKRASAFSLKPISGRLQSLRQSNSIANLVMTGNSNLLYFSWFVQSTGTALVGYYKLKLSSVSDFRQLQRRGGTPVTSSTTHCADAVVNTGAVGSCSTPMNPFTQNALLATHDYSPSAIYLSQINRDCWFNCNSLFRFRTRLMGN